MAERTPFEPRGDYIDGAFALPARPSGEIALECPADLDALDGAFPYSHESIDAAVGAGRRAWPAWRDAPASERAGALERLAALMEAEKESVADVISREVGKPLWEARTEVAAMIGKVAITLEQGLELVAERRFELGPGLVARWRRQARGVLAVLGPFNFPGHLVNGHVIPALATGNVCVIKPSEHTPAVGQLYADLCHRAGVPAGVVNLVQGDGAAGARLVAHPDVDGVLFTGSWSTGRAILEATLDAPQKLVALEMGGSNAVLVCDDADVQAAARAIAFAACVTAGQRCTATRRVHVTPRAAGALTSELVRLMREVRVGDPRVDGTFSGPVISAAARERHRALLRRASDEGADCLVAGGPCDGPARGHWVRPSLHGVRALDPASRYQRDEHFVPDVWLHEVADVDAGIAAIDASDYGLVASVYSADREVYERVYRETRLGLLNWNTTTVGASSRLPFGGAKRSGNDRPAGATSTLYCTYPVGSLETESPAAGAWPGFPEPR